MLRFYFSAFLLLYEENVTTVRMYLDKMFHHTGSSLLLLLLSLLLNIPSIVLFLKRCRAILENSVVLYRPKYDYAPRMDHC